MSNISRILLKHKVLDYSEIEYISRRLEFLCERSFFFVFSLRENISL